jgi:hypothetical protein
MLTIQNWDKISEGVNNSNTIEAKSFYAIRIGSLGAVIVHREIGEDDCVVVEVSNNLGDKTKDIKVWIGSVVFSEPAQLLDLFMERIIEYGWI